MVYSALSIQNKNPERRALFYRLTVKLITKVDKRTVWPIWTFSLTKMHFSFPSQRNNTAWLKVTITVSAEVAMATAMWIRGWGVEVHTETVTFIPAALTHLDSNKCLFYFSFFLSCHHRCRVFSYISLFLVSPSLDCIILYTLRLPSSPNLCFPASLTTSPISYVAEF